MTGIGRASHQDERFLASVEVRAVNNKFLKLNLRLPDGLNGRESDIDRLVREYLDRGTITIQGQLNIYGQVSPYSIDSDALKQYVDQAQEQAKLLHLEPPDRVSDFLTMPGVIADRSQSIEEGGNAEWAVFEVALRDALEKLQTFRRTEGEAMRQALQANCVEIEQVVKSIHSRAPEVVENYRKRVKDRVSDWLSEQGVQIETSDLLREISIFSERCDISEEITRLNSHLSQFQDFLNQEKSTGRKLDFLCQEMFRETNTIGSKANDVTISHLIVETKATIEKIREIVQNVE